MLSSDDNSGLFSFLVGLIVVVLAGVGLSLMVDRRFSVSKNATTLAKELENGQAELEDARSFLQRKSLELAAGEPKRRQISEAYASLGRRLDELDQRKAVMLAGRKRLEREIPLLESEFAGYRRKYRDATWMAAVGEKPGNLILRGGREYLDVVITQVTEVGLEIRHKDGIARIKSQDLSTAMQDRFQWNDKEQQARFAAEEEVHKAMEPNRVIEELVPPHGRESGQSGGPDERKLEALRGKVSAWKAKVSKLKSDHSQALSSASNNSQSSVPGSLETWQVRASRLGGDLARARAELAAARAGLAELSPSDPLLRVGPTDP